MKCNKKGFSLNLIARHPLLSKTRPWFSVELEEKSMRFGIIQCGTLSCCSTRVIKWTKVGSQTLKKKKKPIEHCHDVTCPISRNKSLWINYRTINGHHGIPTKFTFLIELHTATLAMRLSLSNSHLSLINDKIMVLSACDITL